MNRKRDQQIFAMLLFQIVVHMLTQTPWMVTYFHIAVTIYVTNKSADRAAIEQFISSMGEIK
ncbi:hypothetical protein I4U23_015493 [Adineta vaga]|nr:hypothetical protein I4U23_015493 [Adineta vaga]